MLYPQVNGTRSVIDLSGIWEFQLSPSHNWEPIAVPGSYNDQLISLEGRYYCGKSTYRTTITIPTAFSNQRRILRFGAATHDAIVYLDGIRIAQHRGGFLPFEVDITEHIQPGNTAKLEVVVDNRIGHNTLPVGNEKGTAFFGSDNPGIPSIEMAKQNRDPQNLPNFDFFNYAGLIRPVVLYTTPMHYIEDVSIIPSIEDTDGLIAYHVKSQGNETVSIEILDEDGQVVASSSGISGSIRIKNAQLWWPAPQKPYLYTARVHYGEDLYDQTFGIRTVAVMGAQFLINGKPFYFKGPGKHEDSPILGRGLNEGFNVKDIGLFHWLNANSFRTSHYPYAEEMYQLCDQEGILIIDETPAVGINMQGQINPYTTLPLADYHEQVLRDMIQRDKNHPCVVMWSLGNEPDTEHFPEDAYQYWHKLYLAAHEEDPQNRPVTMVCCQNDYTKDITTRTMDVVCINRYYGWYNLSGDLNAATYALNLELDFWEKIQKPLILSEYGADTLAGHHSTAPEMFTEEFQVAYYEAINHCLDQRSFVIGEQPWNFADFDTLQGPMRAGGNRKGMFTRIRQPKMIAHVLRKRWSTISNFEQK